MDRENSQLSAWRGRGESGKNPLPPGYMDQRPVTPDRCPVPLTGTLASLPTVNGGIGLTGGSQNV